MGRGTRKGRKEKWEPTISFAMPFFSAFFVFISLLSWFFFFAQCEQWWNDDSKGERVGFAFFNGLWVG